ncbi:MAG TPA: hypothetical protein DCG72_13460 [Gammaproteobacteria bacterium]|nr:hypothetical protein [Gammaproteobacteria bacterium]
MPGPTLKELESGTYSTSSLSKFTGLDRRTVDKYLEAEGVENASSDPKKNEYNFADAIKAFINCSKGQSSADRRNEAQARKAEVETRILERKFIPIDEIAAPVYAFIGVFNQISQDSSMSNDEKERIIDKGLEVAKQLNLEPSKEVKKLLKLIPSSSELAD